MRNLDFRESCIERKDPSRAPHVGFSPLVRAGDANVNGERARRSHVNLIQLSKRDDVTLINLMSYPGKTFSLLAVQITVVELLQVVICTGAFENAMVFFCYFFDIYGFYFNIYINEKRQKYQTT